MWLRSEDDDHTQTQFVNSGSFHDLRRGLSSSHYLHSRERQGISPSVGDLHFSIRVTESVNQVIILGRRCTRNRDRTRIDRGGDRTFGCQEKSN